MKKNDTKNTDTAETKNARKENRVGYIGTRISGKQLHRMLASTPSPEAREVLKSIFLPRYKVRQDAKGTMGWYKEPDNRSSRGDR